MGLLDLPAPMLDWLDGRLAALPVFLRLLLWGAASGALSMWLYGVLSPQARLARGKAEQARARQRLHAFDGELAEAWPVMRTLLTGSLRQVVRAAVPAVAASVPSLCVMLWVSTVYGYEFPRDGPVAVTVAPRTLEGRLHRTPAGHRVVVESPGRGQVDSLPLPEPVPVIEKRHWWNVLVGNPAGYLDTAGAAYRIDIDLPRRVCLPVGPGWARGWELGFFGSLILVSLSAKRLLGLH